MRRHRTNRLFALIGILALFIAPALFLFWLAYQAHDNRACERSVSYGCWPTEEFFAAYLGVGAIFLGVGLFCLYLLHRQGRRH